VLPPGAVTMSSRRRWPLEKDGHSSAARGQDRDPRRPYRFMPAGAPARRRSSSQARPTYEGEGAVRGLYARVGTVNEIFGMETSAVPTVVQGSRAGTSKPSRWPARRQARSALPGARMLEVDEALEGQRLAWRGPAGRKRPAVADKGADGGLLTDLRMRPQLEVLGRRAVPPVARATVSRETSLLRRCSPR
jgi:hypothetical protein